MGSVVIWLSEHTVFSRLARSGNVRGVLAAFEWLCMYVGIAAVCELLFGALSGDVLATTIFCDALVAAVTLVVCDVRTAPREHFAPICVLLCFVVCLCWCVGAVSSTYVNIRFADTAFSSSSAQTSELYVLFVLVVAPVFEELLFRVGLFGRLRAGHGLVFSAVVSALVFAVAHGTLTHLPMTFLLGCTCVFAYEFGGVIASVVVHFAFNMASYFVAPHLSLPTTLFQPFVIWPLFLGTVAFVLFLMARFESSVGE